MGYTVTVSRDPRERWTNQRTISFSAVDAEGELTVVFDLDDWNAILTDYPPNSPDGEPSGEAFEEVDAIASSRQVERDENGRYIHVL